MVVGFEYCDVLLIIIVLKCTYKCGVTNCCRIENSEKISD